MFILYFPSLCIVFKPIFLLFDIPLAKKKKKKKKKKKTKNYEKCMKKKNFDDFLQ